MPQDDSCTGAAKNAGRGVARGGVRGAAVILFLILVAVVLYLLAT